MEPDTLSSERFLKSQVSQDWSDNTSDPYSEDAGSGERGSLPTLLTNPPVLPDIGNNEEFQVLWDRLWQSERYVRYRLGNHKNTDKWPDIRELAFWKAVVHQYPRGRRKEMYRGAGKLLGRNESIATVISELLNIPDTNHEKARKAISSHLQTLKPFFVNNPFVLDYLKGDHSSRQDHSFSNTRSVARNRHTSHPLRRRNRFTDYNEKTTSPDSFAAAHAYSLPSGPVLPSQASLRGSSLIGYLDFRMYSRDSTCTLIDNPSHSCGRSVCHYQYVHMFTVSKEGSGMPEIRTADFTESIPELRQANVRRAKDCPIIYAQASLAIPAHDLRTDSDVQLLIEGTIATRHQLDINSEWICRTTFYEGHIYKREIEQEIHSINDYGADGLYRHSLPFASKFWADKLVELSGLQRAAARLEEDDLASRSCISIGKRKSPGSLKRTKDLLDQVANRVKNITAVQEILACSASSMEDQGPETHVLILWNFRRTGPNEEGITQFRNIISEQALQPANVGLGDTLDITLQYDRNNNFQFSAYDHTITSSCAQPQQFPREPDLLASAVAFNSSIYDEVFAAFPPQMTRDEHHSGPAENSRLGLNISSGLQPTTQDAHESLEGYSTGQVDQALVPSGVDEDQTIEAPRPESQKSLLTFIRELEHIEQQPPSQQSFGVYENDFTPTESTSSHPTPSYPMDATIVPNQFNSQGHEFYDQNSHQSRGSCYIDYEMSFDQASGFETCHALHPKHVYASNQQAHYNHHTIEPQTQQLVHLSHEFGQQTEAGQDQMQGQFVIPVFDSDLYGIPDLTTRGQVRETNRPRLLPSAIEN